MWSLHLWYSGHGRRRHHVWPEEELLCDWRWRPAFSLHHCPWAWWAHMWFMTKWFPVVWMHTDSHSQVFIIDVWCLVPYVQGMCSICHMTTWRPARTSLGKCRTTTWCLQHLFRSTAPARGPPAALPLSLSFWTVGMVSFHHPLISLYL